MSGFYTGTTTKAPTSRTNFTKFKFFKKYHGDTGRLKQLCKCYSSLDGI